MLFFHLNPFYCHNKNSQYQALYSFNRMNGNRSDYPEGSGSEFFKRPNGHSCCTGITSCNIFFSTEKAIVKFHISDICLRFNYVAHHKANPSIGNFEVRFVSMLTQSFRQDLYSLFLWV